MMRSDLCVEHWLLLDSLCKHKSHRIITINGKINVWKCKLIFPTDRLLQKIEITDLNHFLAAENTFLIVLAITVRHPQQHSIESVLGATGTADRMVVLHFGVLHRCCNVQVFLLKCAASEVAWHVGAVNPMAGVFSVMLTMR